ncbi:hypothetical protein BDN71DRAFT_1436312 [Pleurotus eryngii]|uniref:Uncharacterized protein n=1 Tax=Pleurotus eryngii TaxID=5323 RepID=A0A9P5ZIT1_PLEER|nr:hypothetical protein BDN71DRAFT_1436312 [Pleurotus eryngii]
MPTPAPIFVMAFLSSVKPRSTRSATLAAKAVQEAAEAPQDIVDEEEQPVKKTHVSGKEGHEDQERQEDKAAKTVTKKNMTLTSKILKESRASVAPPPRSAGTGIQLPSTTPCIVSDCARRPDPDSGDNEALQVKADPKDNSNSGNDEEPAPVKDKGKGKAQDLHNLGAELDRDSDADADAGAGAGDEEKDDEDNDEEAAGAAEGEVAGEGDGSDGDDKGNITIMDVDVNITPCKPASKRDASQSPLTNKHTSKAQRHTVSHSSAASSAASLPVPSRSLSPSDNLQELQGASRTTGGFAHSNAFGTAPNMADFVPVDDVPPTETHGKGKILAWKFPTVTESAISLFDVNGEWGVAGPFAVALEDDMDVIWDNDSRLLMLLHMSIGKLPALLENDSRPNILAYLEGDAGLGSAIYKKLWGSVKPGKATLGQLVEQINTDQKKEEKKATKKKAGPSKSNFCLQSYMMLLLVWFLLGLVPCVAAAPKQDPFPNMLFTEFA